jgi:prevent-host-death family protein
MPGRFAFGLLALTAGERELYSLIERTGDFMPTATAEKQDARVVSVLSARSNFGKLLDRVDRQQKSVVIEKRGAPKAVLLSIRDYVKLAAPEPEILRIIGEVSQRNRTDKMTSRQIDDVIQEARAAKRTKRERAAKR